MTRGQLQNEWETQTAGVVRLLFPGRSLTEPDVAEAIDFLGECLRYNDILDERRFLKIFYTIPRQSIREALQSGTTAAQLIQDSAKLQHSLLRKGEIRAEGRTANRANPAEGSKHRRGSRVG